ncbi:MAG: NnrU protein [Alphaproteobacteria bacterium]|nr:NnrU protein [Alphaproteobacteria bacterium]|tara:strand:+ start:276 stop:977 length:702 start_codon:yes stop_codon:yes gene_type:complete
MTGSIDTLFAATVLFVGGHFLLSSKPVRMALIERFGETHLLTYYSLVMIVIFTWMILAFIDTPPVALWQPSAGIRWLPALGMPLAVFLIVCGLTTPSPTIAGTNPDEPGRDLTRGIMRITRHPFLNGMSLWAALHLIANGDDRSIVLFGGLLVLTVVGMWHIDKRREFLFGSDWGPILLTTSAIPFAALLSKRTSFDWPGIGWWRLLLSVAIYLALVWLHPLVLGEAAWPGVG